MLCYVPYDSICSASCALIDTGNLNYLSLWNGSGDAYSDYVVKWLGGNPWSLSLKSSLSILTWVGPRCSGVLMVFIPLIKTKQSNHKREHH